MKINNTKNDIIFTAIKLMTKNGIKQTSLADISKACNISKGTLYYYYPTKDDLILDISTIHLNTITNTVLQCVYEISENNSPKNMINLIIKKMSKLKYRSRIHVYILCEAITSNERLKLLITEKYSQWQKSLKVEIKNVYKNEKESDALAFLVISIVDGLVVQATLQNNKNINYESIANLLVDKLV